MKKNNPTLLILAAGMGSRFGGLKQTAPVGPSGETIIEYSIFDAIRSGFGKVVFVIRKSFAVPFRTKFDTLLAGKMEVEYIFQEPDRLPDGFKVPKGREKPWGTGQAVLMAKDVINEPFAVINADDFYGADAFTVMADFLTGAADDRVYAMVGYRLKNTLSDFGPVSRGVCKTDQTGRLLEITETTKIVRRMDIIVSEGENEQKVLSGDEMVSMNFWGFKSNVFNYLEKAFRNFMINRGNDLKSEFYIPFVVSEMIKTNYANVHVLGADSPWFGVTYQEDYPFAVEEIKNLVAGGVYPPGLWDQA